MAAVVDVLIPTCERPAALAVTLVALGASVAPAMRIVISDQSDSAAAIERPEVAAVLRYLRARGITVDTHRHLPRRGMAEQRAFLLAQVDAPYCLYLDDDVIVEPDLPARLHAAILAQGCGFVGSAVHGLSYLGQVRPGQEQIEFWEGRVEPETVRPGMPAWARHHLHSAANLFHVQSRQGGGADAGFAPAFASDSGAASTISAATGAATGAAAGPGARFAHGSGIHSRLYRVAWIGGCVLFDSAKLRDCGGFEFWPGLPAGHCGEDVLAQLRVMERYGGCGILPSGAYHMELPTTVTTREVDAPYALLGDAGPANAARGADGAAAT